MLTRPSFGASCQRPTGWQWGQKAGRVTIRVESGGPSSVPHCLQSRRSEVRWHSHHTAIQLAFKVLSSFSSKHATQRARKVKPCQWLFISDDRGPGTWHRGWLTDTLHLPGSEMVKSQCSKGVAYDHVSQGSEIHCFAFCLFANWFSTDDSALINLRLKRWDSRELQERKWENTLPEEKRN